MDHEATGILLQRTASPTHGLRTKLTAAVCCLSTGHIRVSSERRFENMVYSTSRVSLLAPRMCLMLYGHLSWRTSDSPVTQGPSMKVPGHSCWRGYNLQAVWAEAEFGKNQILRKQ